MKTSHLCRLNDEELLTRVAELVRESNRNLAVLLQHLAELDSRRLYLEQACSSLFAYCVQRLGFSEAATYNRITAARLGRRFPVVFDRIEGGLLDLTAVRLLAPHLTDENHAELLGAAAGKSKRELELLLAARFPKPDVPTLLRKLPATNSLRRELGLTNDTESATGVAVGASGGTAAARAGTEPREVNPAGRDVPARESTPPSAPKPARQVARLEPLSPSRYKVQFTGSAQLARKIDEARELASHHVNGDDLASLFEKVLDLFIAGEKKRRLAATTKPWSRKQGAQPKSRHVPADVRRSVWKRDEGRCSYVDNKGRRCEERRYLEFDHEVPHARGGLTTVEN